MNINKFLLSLTMAAACASTYAEPNAPDAAASPKTYRFEVLLPGAKQPLPVVVPVGSAQWIQIAGETFDYVKQVTTVPASIWHDLVAAHAEPAHDFVECNSTSCRYGAMGKIIGSDAVAIQVETRGEKILTTTTYDAQVIGEITNYRSGDNVVFCVPQLSSVATTESGELTSGKGLSILKSESGDRIEVRLVAVE